MMYMETKASRKPEIRADISARKSPYEISVIDIGKSAHLTFRVGTGMCVEVSARALLDLVDDLSIRKEHLGFLLGYSDGGNVSFVRYKHSKIAFANRRLEVEYRRRDYVRELQKFRMEGFDAQADIHNHPYEDQYRIPIRHSLRHHTAPFLLRHGLFGELEREGDLSEIDRKSAAKDHLRLEKEGVGYRENFSGVLSMFRVKHVDAAVRVLVLHARGLSREPVGIKITEQCE